MGISSLQRPSRPALQPVLAGLTLLLAGSFTDASAQSRPDKVVRMGSRGRTTDVSGEITENTLQGLRISVRGKEQRVDAEDVVSIRWGDVPASFTDGRARLERGDFENAASLLRDAAGDAATRPVVAAAARLMAAEALMAWGSIDRERYAECIEETGRFLEDHADNREAPRAEWLQARAALLSGDAAGAATRFEALHGKGTGDAPTEGYSKVRCLEAGLQAAQSQLIAGNVGAARTLYTTLASQIGTHVASLDEATTSADVRTRLLTAQGEAACGEGFCLLAEDKLREAETFFGGRMDDAFEAPIATLGMAEVHQAQGKLRQAQIGFAKVSAGDHRSRDRVARALLGLAETTSGLADTDAQAMRNRYLEAVRERYGDTPAALRAGELLGQ